MQRLGRTDAQGRGGIHIGAANDLSFSKGVIQVNRSDLAALDIHLTISNHTGRELFVAALDENPWLYVHWTTRSVNEAGEVETREGRTSGLAGVGPGEFVRLCPWPSGQNQVVYDKPLLYDVRARVPLHQEEDTRYTDVEIEFPLHYYALGATEPARIMVKRAMRVEYRD